MTSSDIIVVSLLLTKTSSRLFSKLIYCVFLLKTRNIYLAAGCEILEKFIYQPLYVKVISKCKPQIIVTLIKSRYFEIYVEFIADYEKLLSAVL